MPWFSKDLITEPACSSLVWRGTTRGATQTLRVLAWGLSRGSNHPIWAWWWGFLGASSVEALGRGSHSSSQVPGPLLSRPCQHP